MTTSQNGWPVDRTGADQDRGPIYGTVRVPNGVREGDAATVLRWVARRYHETVEPLVAGTCWGWYVKPIEGTKAVSNHASGTAIDLNADQHPMGVGAGKTMTAAQIAACRAIVKAAAGVVRWGGDYTGRPDPMHWEIVGSPAATATLAKKIRSEEDDVALTPADGATVWKTDIIPNPAWRGDAKTNPATSAFFAVGDIWNRVHNVELAIAGLATSLKALAGKDVVDEKALAAALAPALAAQVVAALPADRDDITAAELQEAITGALRQLVTP